MTTPGLVIIGAGGFGRETAQAARAGGYPGPVLGFLDDAARSEVAGLPVLGPVARARELTGVRYVVTVGRPDRFTTRHAIVQMLALPADQYATVIHPGANLAPDTIVGPGSVILSGTVATAAVTIGRHVAIMPAAVLTHDCEVDDFATLATGVQLSGGVRVGRGAYLGGGTIVRQEVTIEPWAMTGMGSIVLTDVAERRLVYGVPATDRGPSPAATYDES